jgi:hypothetical protein
MSREKSILGALKIEWETIGTLTLDNGGKLKFPKVPAKGGLYQFNVEKPHGGASRYVGETDNLDRRFGHYRNPGPTQPTNLRINALFKELLSRGETISVAVVTNRAWLLRNSKEETADFSSKNMRRLFENFALVMGKADDVEEINR